MAKFYRGVKKVEKPLIQRRLYNQVRRHLLTCLALYAHEKKKKEMKQTWSTLRHSPHDDEALFSNSWPPRGSIVCDGLLFCALELLCSIYFYKLYGFLSSRSWWLHINFRRTKAFFFR